MSRRGKIEGKMDSQESKLANESPSAFRTARESHLARGRAVLVVRGSNLIRVKADGEPEVVKTVEPPRIFNRGTKFRVR